MKIIGRLGIALACLGAVSTTRATAQDPLSQAKSLYDSAAYTEALAALNQVETTADVVELEKYRALCWLALGRPKDAERSLEHLAMTRPLFTLEGTDVSPKLLALFQDVRRRILPEATKQIYQNARASFDRGDMAQASRQFNEVIALADSAPKENAVLMGELKMLATGFAQLSDAATSKTAAPAPAGTPPSAAIPPEPIPAPAAQKPAASADPAPPSGSPIYSASDTMVTPPVSAARPVPAWVRPEALRYFSFQGSLEVVVDEQGRVVAAAMVKAITPTFDRLLINAAKNWRFEPARLAGQPVKYRLTYQYSLAPSPPK
jgi:TonB family protein